MTAINEKSFRFTGSRIGMVLVVWAIAVSLAGYMGLFIQIPGPGIAFLVIGGIVGLLAFYYRSPGVKAFVSSVHPKYFVLLHLWRILAGFLFLYYGSHHLLPERFVANAGYGDIAVGFSVPLILMLKESAGKYVMFHLFSLLDFVVAVGTDLLFTLFQVPLMETIATFPIVLIPLFGVPVTGASSVMAIDTLLRKQ
ncbi:hypothetical protein [Leptothermofonsia sp. ETS-13]|uniref:hypothetical protein n=1 Tax=Leptothermofonsia sp. ETS-13 TaxID=3035696 RepID=UPI003B9DE65E